MPSLRKTPPVQHHIAHPVPDLYQVGEESDFDILGQVWTIHMVGNLLEVRGELGLTDISQHRIYIYSGQGRCSQEDTLVHELLHAYISMSGVGHWIADPEREEQLVRFLTPLMLHLVKQLRIDEILDDEEPKCTGQKKKSKPQKKRAKTTRAGKK